MGGRNLPLSPSGTGPLAVPTLASFSGSAEGSSRALQIGRGGPSGRSGQANPNPNRAFFDFDFDFRYADFDFDSYHKTPIEIQAA